MDVFPIELIVARKVTKINSNPKLRKVLAKVMWKQGCTKYNVRSINGKKFIGAVFYNNKQVKFKLGDVMFTDDDRFAETLEEFFVRNHAKKQINDYFAYIKECEAAKKNCKISLSENVFSNRDPNYLEGIETIFTNEEIKKIFQKISTPHTRFLCKNFIANLKELHSLAMIYYSYYGGHLLTFLMSLPPIQFADKRCFEVKNYERTTYLIPTLTVKTLRNNGEMTIVFYPALKRGNSFNSVATLINSSKQTIGEINSEGLIVPANRRFNPILSLFAKVVNDKVKISSGIEFGNNCLYCNLPLEDPISIQRGYGKTCAERFDLPY